MFSFRKSAKFGPFRFTASRSGFSMSSGSRNYRRTVSTHRPQDHHAPHRRLDEAQLQALSQRAPQPV